MQQSKAERTRAMIIERSAALFNVKGFAGTSLNDILVATGLKKGGVYGHFNSKQDIAVEVFNYAYAELEKALVAAVAKHENSLEKLKAILSFYQNYSSQPTIEGGCPILNFSMEVDDTNPELRKHLLWAVNRLLKSLTRIIQNGQELNEINQAVNAEQFAVLMYAQIEGGIMLSKLEGNDQKLQLVLNLLSNQIEQQLPL
ncbi:TetR/AcrR family transcriptional regulator [Solitalea longa]|uniref:TetR/AcrR family transcriptional regulator n=1 Tax=Solitalea longa TaxID=2079460 RepID=A0A2S4ZYN4_9SPHI|nr:TetR/AcrR family transcriptional regulator [Solitalea longa]POY35107.1 TetR/AcrR family transcriptional regulator [Solitalea longa]